MKSDKLSVVKDIDKYLRVNESKKKRNDFVHIT